MRPFRPLLIATLLFAAAPRACPGAPLPATPRAALSFTGVARPAFTAEMETKILLGAPPPLPGHRSGGATEFKSRDWMLELALGPGITFAKLREDHMALTATARVGLMKRLSGGLDKRFGAVLVGWANPEAIGPALRLEAEHAFGVQAGWLFIGSHGDGAMVSLDVSFALIEDILNPPAHRE
jgi:hypothetical protein